MNKNTVLLCVAIATFLTAFMGSSINVALPAIGREFHMDAITLSWVTTSYLLAATVLLIPMGRLADIYGRKRIFTYGVLIYSVASAVLTAAPSALVLIVCRILQGMGGALIFTTGTALITSVFPLGERGKALGIFVTAVYTGLSFGPFLGGFLSYQFGWRSIFLATLLPIVVVIFLIYWRFKGEWAESKGEPFDYVGAIISALGIVAVMYGFSSLPSMIGIILLAMGLASLIAFILWEIRVKHPVLNIKLFMHNRAFVFSSMAALISYSATNAIGFLLSLYLQYIKGLDSQSAGLILVMQPAMQAVFSPIAGRLSDRMQPRIIASTGMSLTCLGLIAFTFLNEQTEFWYITAALGILGLGFALFSSPNTNAIMTSVDKNLYGVASAVVSVMRQFGMILSMGITMLLFALFMGQVQITPAYYPAFLQSINTAFIIFVVLCFLGIFASLARGNSLH